MSEDSQSRSLNSVSELASLVKPGIILSAEDSLTIAQLAANKARATALLSGLLGDDGSLVTVTKVKEISVDD